VVDLVGYEDHLRKTQPDWESRWENVQELITFASEIEADIIDVDQHQPMEAGDSSVDTPK
jgi:DNA helicase-2/ATP-dependent DNA helicase PcrA